MNVKRADASQFRTWVLFALLIIPAGLIRPVQDRIESHLSEAPDADLLYFNTPATVKRLSLGYESLVADSYWIRVIQYYGRRDLADKRPVRYKNLASLLDIATTLDPDLIDAYRAGTTFLSEPDPIGAGQPAAALQLLDKGMAAHPNEWRLGFDKGFVYFTYLKDAKKAGHVWLAASQIPEAPRWMEALAAMAFTRGGDIETAKTLWKRQYMESTRAEVRDNAFNRLNSLQVAEDIWTLEFFIEKYRETKSVTPRKLTDLIDAGYLRLVPPDPSGMPYEYDSARGEVRLSPQSKVRYLQVPDEYRAALREKLGKVQQSAESLRSH